MNRGIDRDRLITGMIWAASVLWMCFCLFLSWQPGDDTVSLSRAAAQTVRRIIHVFGVEIDLNSLHTWLRKSAHAVLFFISGILFFCSFARSLKGRRDALAKGTGDLTRNSGALAKGSRTLTEDTSSLGNGSGTVSRCGLQAGRGSSRISLQPFILSATLCSACAVIAEAGKAWIPGRHLQWSETLLDIAGAVCGAGIAAAAAGAAKHMKHRRN